MLENLASLDFGKPRSGQPKYERLKEHFINEMIAGRLKSGQALPSEPQLARALGIAKMTVRQAMDSLENEGLIRREKGKGTFIDQNVRRKLKRGQDIFALVVPETHGGYFPSLLHGCEAAASQFNHQLLVCNTDDSVDRQADIILQLLDKEVGGVAIMPTSYRPTPDYHIRQLQNHGIPVVFCHRRVEGISAPLLATPYVNIGRLAGETLLERGHRNVAYLATEPSKVGKAYERGFQEAFGLAGIKPLPKMLCVSEAAGQDEEEKIMSVLAPLFKTPDPPTAIFASFDTLAESLYLLLPRLGLRVPEDVSLIGYGGALREGAIAKRLTSVVIDAIAVGNQAVSLLHEMRTGARPIDDNTETTIELGLYEGVTVNQSREAVMA
jgi:GntR family transcriptional regulator, arabinose operon transcriptional repressor